MLLLYTLRWVSYIMTMLLNGNGKKKSLTDVELLYYNTIISMLVCCTRNGQVYVTTTIYIILYG